jgi:uncharacterized protein (DUF58 family)
MERTKLFNKVKNIQLVSLNLAEGLFAGNYRSVFRGPGIEFDEVREYQPEEDSRLIDWNVSSRIGKPYVKTFREERELTLFFLIDVSASLFFGSGKENKFDAACMLTALLSFAAVSNNDKVGAVLFSDRIEQWTAPRKGKKHTLRLLNDLLRCDPAGKGSDLALAVRTVHESLPRRGICFIITDFKTETGYKEMTLLARKHDVIAVTITDPLDFSFPAAGYLKLIDSETGRQTAGFGKSAQFKRAYYDFWYSRYEKWQQMCRKQKIDTLVIDTRDDVAEKLLAFFKKRQK